MANRGILTRLKNRFLGHRHHSAIFILTLRAANRLLASAISTLSSAITQARPHLLLVMPLLVANCESFNNGKLRDSDQMKNRFQATILL